MRHLILRQKIANSHLISYSKIPGKTLLFAVQCLDKRYRDSVPRKSTIIDWYAEFKKSRTNIDDAERSGRPKAAVVLKYITIVHKIALVDRRFKSREIANTLKISEGSVFTILHECGDA